MQEGIDMVINLRSVPKDLHRAVKVAAAKRGVTMLALVIQILTDWLTREGEQIGRLSVILALGLMLSACGFPTWRDQTLRDVAEGRSHLDVSQIPPSGSGPSQTIEFQDNAGRTVGYGRR
jgi:plasmid stability protein